MTTLFDKRNLPFVILNVITILVVAIMLVVTQATAKTEQTSQALNSGMLSYQGTLMDQDGTPVTGSYEMVFRIYNSLISTTPLWEEGRFASNAVPVQNGLFNIMLGSFYPIPSTVWEEAELYLGVKIGSDAEMSPREKLTVVPSASMAAVAQLALTVPQNSLTGENIVDGSLSHLDAPMFLRSDDYQYEIVRSGRSIFPGSNEKGEIVIPYTCFPHEAIAFFAINGHWDAVNSQVVATQSIGKCETTIVVSPPTPPNWGIRIQWMAIGY